jgi:hypothetical protein
MILCDLGLDREVHQATGFLTSGFAVEATSICRCTEVQMRERERERERITSV